jgi:hypothetical protein
MRMRGIARVLICAGLGALLPAPAFATHWVIYAPDEAGYRYWLDTDSVVTKGDGYTYAYYSWGDPARGAPESSGDPIIGINCATGVSVQLKDGAWNPGNHFTDKAYLFRALCQGALARSNTGQQSSSDTGQSQSSDTGQQK